VKTQHRGPARRELVIQVLLVVVGITAISLSIGPALLRSLAEDGPRNDFISFYVGAHLVGGGKLYDAEKLAEKQANLGLKPTQYKLPFIRLPFYAIVLYPLSRLEYRTAYLLWQLLSVGSVIVTIFLWRRLGVGWVAVAFAWSVPLAVSLLRGQDIAFLLLLISIAAALLRTRREVLAGLVFACCAIKWHLLLSLPLLFVGRRLWKCGAAFGIGLGLLLGFCFLVAGSGWPLEYYRLIMEPATSPYRSEMVTLSSLFYGFPAGAILEGLAAVLVLWLGWIISSRSIELEYALSGVLVSGLLISHHAYLYDCLIILPGLALTARSATKSWMRNLAILLLTPPFYVLFWYSPWSRISQLGLPLLLLLMVGNLRVAKEMDAR
jgi:hypothetical protein